MNLYRRLRQNVHLFIISGICEMSLKNNTFFILFVPSRIAMYYCAKKRLHNWISEKCGINYLLAHSKVTKLRIVLNSALWTLQILKDLHKTLYINFGIISKSSEAAAIYGSTKSNPY